MQQIPYPPEVLSPLWMRIGMCVWMAIVVLVFLGLSEEVMKLVHWLARLTNMGTFEQIWTSFHSCLQQFFTAEYVY